MVAGGWKVLQVKYWTFSPRSFGEYFRHRVIIEGNHMEFMFVLLCEVDAPSNVGLIVAYTHFIIGFEFGKLFDGSFCAHRTCG